MPQILGILKGFNVVDTLVKILITLAVAGILIAILPVSPFQAIVESIEQTPYLGYLNWFFPVGKCLTVLISWCAAIGIFYGISWILRQLNIIGS